MSQLNIKSEQTSMDVWKASSLKRQRLDEHEHNPVISSNFLPKTFGMN